MDVFGGVCNYFVFEVRCVFCLVFGLVFCQCFWSVGKVKGAFFLLKWRQQIGTLHGHQSVPIFGCVRGARWALLGRFRGALGCSGALSGRSCALLGALGALGRSWALLGRSGLPLGRSGLPLGRSRGVPRVALGTCVSLNLALQRANYLQQERSSLSQNGFRPRVLL